ncbi:MAG: hypothetical protein ABW095_13150 [Candidatus Thiodiazotropha sp.]
MASVKEKGDSTLDLINSLKLSSTSRQLQNANDNPSHLNAEAQLAQLLNAQGLEDYRFLSRPTYVPINSEEEERKRISRELHDGLG